MTQNSLPKIGITMGDAAGIGAEITLKALSQKDLTKVCQPVIIGDFDYLLQTASNLDLSFDFVNSEKVEQIVPTKSIIVYNLSNLPKDLPVGIESEAAGRASAEYITAAVELWEKGEIDAITTAPINKKSINMAGFDFPGHTEFIANLTDTDKFAMSFFAEKLRVVLLSTHLPLVDAIKLVKTDKLVELIKFTNEELKRLLNRDVKLAVAGLNPHASEGGMFGQEEFEEITPAITKCRENDAINVEGPFSPDTIFLRAFQGEFDGVISCYHDQATIAVKCLSFGSSVNVTLGLPLIRTSVDHGTAFDIANKNLADSSSLKTAIKLAAELVNIRRSSAQDS